MKSVGGQGMAVTDSPVNKLAFPGLEQVEGAMREALQPAPGELGRMMQHLLQAPGKKVRPLLVLLSASLVRETGGLPGPPLSEEAVAAAAAVELIHTASLVHDDIIDGASLRRGIPTLHSRWDSGKAVVIGDFLLARAFRLLSGLSQAPDLLPLMARAVSFLCRGEAGQWERRFDWLVTEKEYFRFNYLKTSYFLAACCEAGGIAAGNVSQAQRRALRRYGRALGEAFQVVDDILDFSENASALGKPVGSDLGQGIATLPLICLVQARGRYRELLRELQGRPLPEALREELVSAVRQSGALDRSRRRALASKEAALEALRAFPCLRTRHRLGQMAEAVTGRASIYR